MEGNNSRPVSRDVQYLARLLSYSLKGEGQLRIAEELLTRFGSLSLVFDAPLEALCSTDGMTENAAILIKLAASLSSRRVTDTFRFGIEHTEEEIEEYLIALFVGVAVETVYMLVVDEDNRITRCEYMGEGTVGTSDVYPRRLLERAVRSGAKGVILAHNHPRGKVEPSDTDIIATKRLSQLFMTSGIRLISHYTVSDGRINRVEEPD